MHEYPITCEIINIATNALANSGGVRVSKISIVAGDLCGYVSDSIQMYFDEIAKGTPCENAVLEIKRVVPQLKCEKCSAYFIRKMFSFTCPYCGGEGMPSEIGKEFYIDYIETEE